MKFEAATRRLETASDKLRNGRYRCSHDCDDRAACRHKCCRVGLKYKRKGQTTNVAAQIGDDQEMSPEVSNAGLSKASDHVGVPLQGLSEIPVSERECSDFKRNVPPLYENKASEQTTSRYFKQSHKRNRDGQDDRLDDTVDIRPTQRPKSSERATEAGDDQERKGFIISKSEHNAGFDNLSDKLTSSANLASKLEPLPIPEPSHPSHQKGLAVWLFEDDDDFSKVIRKTSKPQESVSSLKKPKMIHRTQELVSSTLTDPLSTSSKCKAWNKSPLRSSHRASPLDQSSNDMLGHADGRILSLL